MKPLPKISIVVPSYNQAQYLAETLQSLVDQEYPALEVIIQEGVSNDDSVAIAEDFVRRYPSIFRLFVEKDSGQADALNRGFARASGEILAFLNSDDTYLPGILHRVAAEIDLARGRYVVMGRCLFTGEGSRYSGVEHPAEYQSHFEHLAIWKRGYNTVPQPSVFGTAPYGSVVEGWTSMSITLLTMIYSAVLVDTMHSIGLMNCLAPIACTTVPNRLSGLRLRFLNFRSRSVVSIGGRGCHPSAGDVNSHTGYTRHKGTIGHATMPDARKLLLLTGNIVSQLQNLRQPS